MLCVAPDNDGKARWTLQPVHSNAKVPLLAYAPQSGLGRILATDWKERNVTPHVEAILSARLAAALLTFAEDGGGLAWLPLSLAFDSLKTGRLARATEDPLWTTALDIVLYRPSARLTHAAAALWNDIIQRSRKSEHLT